MFIIGGLADGTCMIYYKRYLVYPYRIVWIESASERRSSEDLFYWNVLGKMVPVRRCSSPAIPFIPQMLDCTCSFNKLRLFPRCVVQ